ncbi:MAG: nucleotidyltransferase domain-containing protein [Thaumarchaeota archaeon]|nr:nucleotidyltransferase domain-containing protein [Nitrososphaerota archaeon]
MKTTPSHQRTIAALKERVLSELRNSIDSLILYGSAARGEYRGIDSDIDILLIAEDRTKLTYEKARKIATEIDLENATATTLVHLSRKEFEQNIKRSPFLQNVLEEGVVLYDNGTFERFRESLLKASR